MHFLHNLNSGASLKESINSALRLVYVLRSKYELVHKDLAIAAAPLIPIPFTFTLQLKSNSRNPTFYQ